MPRALRKPHAAALAFDALTVEGALIAPAMLARIAEQKAGGQADSDYNIPKGLTLRDEIARYFRIGQALFTEIFVSATPSTAATTRFVEALLRDVFGFADISRVGTRTLDERLYVVTLEALGGRVPVVVVPPSDDLDAPSAHLPSEGRRRSAVSAVQDWLNATDGTLWGLCSNGIQLRLLRDNASLTRPAFIEADLRRIFEGEAFADFTALWLLIHASRFGTPGTAPTDCPLEHWRAAGAKEGVAARERLRGGVEAALLSLGGGFLGHPDNVALRERLGSGALPLPEYFGQLLRLVYRLIFLLAAEDRSLLHPPSAPAAARRLYAEGYSVGALRDRAVRRAAWDRHHDRWEGLLIVFAALAGGERRLGLPALGGLFDPGTMRDLEAARVANRDLMEAVYRLAWLREDYGPVPVNWRDMETEELGSVYEGLLELTPQLTENGRGFTFAEGGKEQGHARKTTGSYYTPDSLVQALLDSALDPVLDRVEAEAEDPAAALLSVTVVDPACGSGHFLLAAARRIATRVARHRAEGVASAEDYRHALREVARACVHGVDRNPLAIELTKVALWIETVDPGKPLGFLDANIRCGDSLLGVFDLDALRHGVPDAAYKPFTGDDKETAKYFEKRNKDERAGQGNFDFVRGGGQLPAAMPLAAAARVLRAMPEDSLDDIAAKRRRFAAGRADPRLWGLQIAADLYTAAFLGSKTGGVPPNRNTVTIPTTAHVWEALAGRTVYGPLVGRAQDVAGAAHAFHWPLEFPDVMVAGGFDVVIGNPPWLRQEMLTSVKRHLSIFETFSSTADSSVYFIERSMQLTRPEGRIGVLTPNKWFRASYANSLRALLRDCCRVNLIVDFGHSRNLFPNADTFPAALVFERVSTRVQGSEAFRFTRAHDSDRAQYSLPELIRHHAVAISHVHLRRDGWRLETDSTNDLLTRLMSAGERLETVLKSPILSGLKTGLNQAFYLTTPLRNALVSADPTSEPLFKRFLRGRDIKRWAAVWGNQWHIVIASSQNQTWPWSHALNEHEAEEIFSETYPHIYSHLKQFEQPLRLRQDKGEYWWELRSCDYYDVFDAPKIVVQCIAYYSRFAFDAKSYYINNKAILIPTGDLYVLALLNSQISWWIINKTFQHMKDDGLSIDIQFLKRMPIPNASADLRLAISNLASMLITAETFAEDELAEAEIQLNRLVEQAFDLTDTERDVIVSNLPPRDPLVEIRRTAEEAALRPMTLPKDRSRVRRAYKGAEGSAGFAQRPVKANHPCARLPALPP